MGSDCFNLSRGGVLIGCEDWDMGIGSCDLVIRKIVRNMIRRQKCHFRQYVINSTY